MKFRHNASEVAIHKSLGVFSTVFFIQGLGVILFAFIVLINSLVSETGGFSGDNILTLILYVVVASVLIAFGVMLKNIQSDMIED